MRFSAPRPDALPTRPAETIYHATASTLCAGLHERYIRIVGKGDASGIDQTSAVPTERSRMKSVPATPDCDGLFELAVLAAATVDASNGSRASIETGLAGDAGTCTGHRQAARFGNLLSASQTEDLARARRKPGAGKPDRVADRVVYLILNSPIRGPSTRHETPRFRCFPRW